MIDHEDAYASHCRLVEDIVDEMQEREPVSVFHVAPPDAAHQQDHPSGHQDQRDEERETVVEHRQRIKLVPRCHEGGQLRAAERQQDERERGAANGGQAERAA